VAVKSLFSRQKMERKYLFCENCSNGFQYKFLDSCNTRFESSQSDNGKRYFQKLDFKFSVTSSTSPFYPWKRTKR